jgi:hypothetical protein
VRFLRGKGGKTRREGIRNKNFLRIIELSIFEDKLLTG